MDHFFDELVTLNTKRRTTYKKSTDTEQNESPLSDPLVMGHGFLFQNDTINKVRDRLNGDERPSALEDLTQVVSQTQVITNFYDGGEEVEMEKVPPKMAKSPIKASQTQSTASKNDYRVTQRDSTVVCNVGMHVKDLDIETQRPQRAESHGENSSPSTERHFESTQKVCSTFADNDNLNGSGISSNRYADRPKLKIHAILEELNEQEDLNYRPLNRKQDTAFKKKTFVSKESFLQDFDDSGSEDDNGALDITQPCALKNEHSTPSKTPDVNFTLAKKYGSLKNYENELKRESNPMKLFCFVLTRRQETSLHLKFQNLSHLKLAYWKYEQGYAKGRDLRESQPAEQA